MERKTNSHGETSILQVNVSKIKKTTCALGSIHSERTNSASLHIRAFTTITKLLTKII